MARSSGGWHGSDTAEMPIREALPALTAALRQGATAVLVAPPGAGKTTIVPLALLPEPWVGAGKLIVLEPRRLAARAAAARMASNLGEAVGQTVGYRVRLETRVSRMTRIEVVTEGIFTRMILDDPGLEGVSGVLFDEFHERSLDADLGLAFARNSQTLLREDLRIVVMSATLDGARVAGALGGASVIESKGRAFPIVTRYLGRELRTPIESQMAKAIARALANETGGVLAFLPGQGEILRTIRRLEETGLNGAVDIFPLYGALDVIDQDRAMAPARSGRRKVVVATSIAETSLTLDGVSMVIDSGLARTSRWHAGSGLSRLTTGRVSRASADQRRGRAGRTGPGVCWRLWDEAETRALAPFDQPEILQTDLSRLVLDLARWGVVDPGDLAFLDLPSASALDDARVLLQGLGALDAAGVVTVHGQAMARLPLPPRLAHMVLTGAKLGQAKRAALLAGVITERGLGGADIDISSRADRFAKGQGPRERAALGMVERWAATAGGVDDRHPFSDGLLVAAAYPERVAKARETGGAFQLASGRGAVLDPADTLASASWLAVAELGGATERDRILLAARLDIVALRSEFPAHFSSEDRLVDTPGGRRRVQRILRLGQLIVEAKDVGAADPAAVTGALLEDVRRLGIAALPWGPRANGLRERVGFLRAGDPGWPDLSDESLCARLDQWLSPLLMGKETLAELDDGPLEVALRGLIPPDRFTEFERLAPAYWTAPTGSSHRIDYGAQGGPRLEIRVQELFGLRVHPTVGAGARLVLALLSPAHRPIQLTRDLPGFWAGSWAEVRKEMRGRYPRHVWPDDPANSVPTSRAKPRS